MTTFTSECSERHTLKCDRRGRLRKVQDTDGGRTVEYDESGRRIAANAAPKFGAGTAVFVKASYAPTLTAPAQDDGSDPCANPGDCDEYWVYTWTYAYTYFGTLSTGFPLYNLGNDALCSGDLDCGQGGGGAETREECIARHQY